MLKKFLVTPLRCLTSTFLATTMAPKKKRALAEEDGDEETATVPAKKTKTKTTGRATKASRAKKSDDDGEYCSVPLPRGVTVAGWERELGPLRCGGLMAQARKAMVGWTTMGPIRNSSQLQPTANSPVVASVVHHCDTLSSFTELYSSSLLCPPHTPLAIFASATFNTPLQAPRVATSIAVEWEHS